jgi:exodeoxyribonuclease VII small subunit
MPKQDKSNTKDAKDAEQSYQVLRAELDTVIARLQDPAGDVDDAVALYEQAMQLTRKLEKHLEAAENRIKKVQVDFGMAEV